MNHEFFVIPTIYIDLCSIRKIHFEQENNLFLIYKNFFDKVDWKNVELLYFKIQDKSIVFLKKILLLLSDKLVNKKIFFEIKYSSTIFSLIKKEKLIFEKYHSKWIISINQKPNLIICILKKLFISLKFFNIKDLCIDWHFKLDEVDQKNFIKNIHNIKKIIVDFNDINLNEFSFYYQNNFEDKFFLKIHKTMIKILQKDNSFAKNWEFLSNLTLIKKNYSSEYIEKINTFKNYLGIGNGSISFIDGCFLKCHINSKMKICQKLLYSNNFEYNLLMYTRIIIFFNYLPLINFNKNKFCWLLKDYLKIKENFWSENLIINKEIFLKNLNSFLLKYFFKSNFLLYEEKYNKENIFKIKKFLEVKNYW